MSEHQHRVVIVGAGIVGLCSALWLQRSGISDIALVDRGDPGMGTSFGNAGAIATYSVEPVATAGTLRQLPTMLANAQSPLAIRWRYLPKAAPWLIRFLMSARPAQVEHASRVLAGLQQHVISSYEPLVAESGAGPLFRPTDVLYIYGSDKSLSEAAHKLTLQERRGVAFDRLDARQVHELEPEIAPVYAGGIAYRDAFYLTDPRRFTAALFQRFRDQGGTFVSDEVHALRLSGNETQAVGSRGAYTGRQLVVAAGAWSAALCRSLDESVPLDTERGYHVMFPQAAGKVRHPVCWADIGYYLTPMAEGLRVAGTVEIGGLKAPANPRRIAMLKNGARRLVPDIGTPGSEWLGFRPSLPDSLPIIGRSARSPSVIYAFGHGHLGMTLGAVTGRLVSDLVVEREPVVDLHPLRPGRFG